LPSSSDLPKDLFTVEQVLLSQGCRVYQLKKKDVFFVMRLNRNAIGLNGLFSIGPLNQASVQARFQAL